MSETTSSPAQDDGAGVEFHVSYFDDRCNRTVTEILDDETAAYRLADRMVAEEHEWAVVDKIYLKDRAHRAA